MTNTTTLTNGSTSCTHTLAGGSLECTNPRPHEPGHGCTYASATGSWLEAE